MSSSQILNYPTEHRENASLARRGRKSFVLECQSAVTQGPNLGSGDPGMRDPVSEIAAARPCRGIQTSYQCRC